MTIIMTIVEFINSIIIDVVKIMGAFAIIGLACAIGEKQEKKKVVIAPKKEDK